MAEVQRIYPEAKTALINWIEENFHDIESYVFTCLQSDGTTMTIHHVKSKIEARGLLAIASEGEFSKAQS